MKYTKTPLHIGLWSEWDVYICYLRDMNCVSNLVTYYDINVDLCHTMVNMVLAPAETIEVINLNTNNRKHLSY